MKKIGFIGKTILGLEAILLGLTIGCDIKNDYQAPPTKPNIEQQDPFTDNFLSETERRRYLKKNADGTRKIDLDEYKSLIELIEYIPEETTNLTVTDYIKNAESDEYNNFKFWDKKTLERAINIAEHLFKYTKEAKNGEQISNEFLLAWFDYLKLEYGTETEKKIKLGVYGSAIYPYLLSNLDACKKPFALSGEDNISKVLNQFWKSPYRTEAKRKIAEKSVKPEIEKPEYVENYLIQDDLGYVSIRKYEDGHKTIFCRSDKCKTEEEFKFDKEKTEEFINMIKQRKKETEHIKETTDYWKFNSGSTYEILLKN